MLVLISIL